MRKSLVLTTSALSFLLAGVELGAAKSKKDPHGNCSMAQLQTPAARECLKKYDQDIMSDAPLRQVYCSSSGVLLCCPMDGAGTIQDHTGSVASRMQKKLQGVTTPKGGAAAQ